MSELISLGAQLDDARREIASLKEELASSEKIRHAEKEILLKEIADHTATKSELEKAQACCVAYFGYIETLHDYFNLPDQAFILSNRLKFCREVTNKAIADDNPGTALLEELRELREFKARYIHHTEEVIEIDENGNVNPPIKGPIREL